MKVLLATDGSMHANEAAWVLSHLPHSEQLELIVLTVVYVPATHGTIETRTWISENANVEKQRAKKTFEKVEEMFRGANVSLKHLVIEGHVAATIVDQAESLRPDLVVVGAQGLSAIERALLGSVSDFVATHAPCSVLVVRATGLRDEKHRRLRVCIGYDESPPSEHAIQELGKFGWGNNTEIDVVNIVSFFSLAPDESLVQIDTNAILVGVEESVRDAAEELRTLTPNVQSFVRQFDHIGYGITSFADERDSDLVVLGDTGRGMLGRFFLGSVSRYVVRHANCSVWIARKPK